MVKGHDIRRALGQIVRKLRFDQNISQEKIAELGSLDRSYISEIENRDKTASIITVYKLSVALGIKPSEFMHELEKYIEFNF